MPVSPPPITTTCLPSAVIRPRRDLATRPSIGHPAVAAVEVLHREVDAGEIAAGDLEVALDPRTGREDDGVVFGPQLAVAEVAADVDVADELDPLLLEHGDAAVDDPLLELGVGDAEAQQAAGGLVALVDGDPVADLVELVGGGEAGGTGADDGDAAAGPLLGRLGVRPSPA